jgi:hypothetical protein
VSDWPTGYRVPVAGSGQHELQLVGAQGGLNRVDCRCGAHLGLVPTAAGTEPAQQLWRLHRDDVLRQEVGA